MNIFCMSGTKTDNDVQSLVQLFNKNFPAAFQRWRLWSPFGSSKLVLHILWLNLNYSFKKFFILQESLRIKSGTFWIDGKQCTITCSSFARKPKQKALHSEFRITSHQNTFVNYIVYVIVQIKHAMQGDKSFLVSGNLLQNAC